MGQDRTENYWNKLLISTDLSGLLTQMQVMTRHINMDNTQSSSCPQRGQCLIKQSDLPGAIKFSTKRKITSSRRIQAL